MTMPVAFAFFPSAITVVSGAFDTLGSTVNAALSWPSTRPEQASVIANATNRILVFLLFIYSFPLFSAHSVKFTVRICPMELTTTASAIFFKLSFARSWASCSESMGHVFPDVVHGPFRKLKRVCVNKRHAQLSYWILRGSVSGVF